MITVYPANATDFSGNGLCALAPSTCVVTETLNGEWELSLIHPLDEQDKWSQLQVGNIIKAPVPSALSPRQKLILSTEGKDVYRVSISSSARLKLYSRASGSSICLGAYRNETRVQVLDKSNVSYYEVLTPDGKRGYLAKGSLQFLRTESSNTSATNAIVSASQTRDQPFRIYRMLPSLTAITVYARHLSYDLMDNLLYQYKPAKGTSGATIAAGILSRCQSAQPFTMFSNLTAGVDDLVLENINPMEALLGEGHLADKTQGEMTRDWYDLYLLRRVGRDTDIQVRQGKNLLGIQYDVDDGNVVTRLVPTGETEEGELLYLDGKYVDSPHIAAYPNPRWGHLAVSEARVGEDLTLAQAKAKLTAAAQEEFSKGCDLPDITIQVDFISLADTEEYAQYRPLADIFLGDALAVIVPSLSLEVSLRMTEYSYDCLLRRYVRMTLGSASKTMSGSMISPRQLPSGGISGMKLALGAIGTGHLQRASIGSLQVKTAAIDAAHIQQAAIGEAHIKDANITTAKIADAAVTNAKIALANITTAHIADAAITSAKIGTAEVKEANIEDLSVTGAKIARATITSAQIAAAAIQTADIKDLAVTHAKIYQGEADEFKIQTANIATAAIGSAQIADLAVSNAKIANAAIDNIKIQDAAISRAKIAQAAVGSAQIEDAAITAAKIGLAAIESAHIGTGVIGTSQIADGSITDAKIVGLTANKITAGTIDAANITVVNLNAASITVGMINGQQIAPNAIGEGHIGQGVITSDMIANDAIGGEKIKIGSIAAERLKLSQHILC